MAFPDGAKWLPSVIWHSQWRHMAFSGDATWPSHVTPHGVPRWCHMAFTGCATRRYLVSPRGFTWCRHMAIPRVATWLYLTMPHEYKVSSYGFTCWDLKLEKLSKFGSFERVLQPFKHPASSGIHKVSKRSNLLLNTDETRPRGLQFHVVLRQKLFRTYQF